jgi:branched-chain amino acid aminotransferase
MPLARASVALADEGLLRGDGCFEVVRVCGGRPVALEEHLQRMERSAAALRLPTEGARAALEALSPGFDGYVRVLVTRGPPPHVYGLQEEITESATPMRLKSVPAPWVAPLGSAPLAGAKTLSYAHNMAARRLAEESGYDDALLTTPDGIVLEGPTWSILWAEGAHLLTPPLDLGILDSITRRAMKKLAQVAECTAPLERVLAADEVLVVSTTREGIGVSCIDDRQWRAPGARTRELAERLRAHLIEG